MIHRKYQACVWVWASQLILGLKLLCWVTILADVWYLHFRSLYCLPLPPPSTFLYLYACMYVYICICFCECWCVCTCHVSWDLCGGQKSILLNSSWFLPWLRQGLLFKALYTRLADLWSSGHSRISFLYLLVGEHWDYRPVLLCQAITWALEIRT